MTRYGSRTSHRISVVLAYLQIAIVLLVLLFPILWMISSSLKNNVDIIAYPPRLLAPPTMDNYRHLFGNYPFVRYTINSVIIVSGSTLLGMILGVPAAYAAARFKMQSYAFLTLVARMAPGILFLLPWYVVAINLKITDNYLSLIAAHTVVTMPVIIWLMISFFEELPVEVEESGRIDGCSRWQVLTHIALPMALPGISVSAILAFIFSWNYFLFALVLSGFNTAPLTVAAFNFIGVAAVDWGGLMSAATMISLPPLILLLFVQRWLVRGLTAGAVKG